MLASHHDTLGVNVLLHAILEGITTGAFHNGTSDRTAFGQGGEGWVVQHMGGCNVHQ